MATHRVDTLRFARVLRRQGLVDAAAEVLDVAAAQAQAAIANGDPDIAADQVAWLYLERADLAAEAGQRGAALQWVQMALDLSGQVGDRALAAAAWLAQADLAAAVGDGAAASAAWSQARAFADAAGAHPLAARALLGLAIRELSGGEADVAETLLAAAGRRVHADADAPDAPAALRHQRLALQTSVAVLRARQSVQGRRWAEARLLLATAVDAAREVAAPELMVDCLRLDAALARRCGDPHGAVEGLAAAIQWAMQAGASRLVWLLRAEQALAAVDDEDLSRAAALLRDEPPEGIAALPAIAAARAEAAAAVAEKSGDLASAIIAWQHAASLRQDVRDHAGLCRTLSAWAETLRLSGDLAAAAALLDRAAGLAERLQRMDLAVQPALGRAAVAQQREGLAVDDAARVVALAVAHGSVAEQLAALQFATMAHLAAGAIGGAQAIAQQATQLAEAQPLVRYRARALALQANLSARTSPPTEALAAAQEAQKSALAAGDAAAGAQALLAAGGALSRMGRADEARLAWSHAATVAMSGHRDDLVVAAQLATAESHAQLAEWDAAAVGFAMVMQTADARGIGPLQVAARRGHAWCDRSRGNLAAAVRWTREALRMAEQLGHTDLQWTCRTDLAELDLLQGRREPARALGDAAALAVATPATRGEALRVAAQAAAVDKDFKQARQWLQRAEADLRSVHADRALGAVLTLAGQVHAALGDGEAAGRALGEALALTIRLGLPEQELVRSILARMTDQPFAPT